MKVEEIDEEEKKREDAGERENKTVKGQFDPFK